AAAPAAGPAGSLDHLALTVAARAARHIDDLAEDRLGRTSHLSRASTLRTGLRRRARLSAGTLAGFACLSSRNGQLALDTADGFFETESQVEPKVCPSAGARAGSPRGGRAEEHVENVVDAAEVVAGHTLGSG